MGGAVAQWYSVGLAINRSLVQIILEATLRNNLGQVVHTLFTLLLFTPLSPSSITWYRPMGGDALNIEYKKPLPFWATVCKMVRPMLSNRCLSVCAVCF